MKNKKILNIFLLIFGLAILITFLLPLKKYSFVGTEIGFIKIMFFVLNAIMLSAITILIVVSIINLFKDNYSLVTLMEFMALLSMIMVFLTIIIFASSSQSKIGFGYLLVTIEMFVCANFSQGVRLMSRSCGFKTDKISDDYTRIDDTSAEIDQYNNDIDKSSGDDADAKKDYHHADNDYKVNKIYKKNDDENDIKKSYRKVENRNNLVGVKINKYSEGKKQVTDIKVTKENKK